MVEHFHVTFSDRICSGVWDIVQIKTDRETDRQTNKYGENPTT